MTMLYVDVRDSAQHPLDPAEGLAFATTDANGAEVLFTGTVRNLNQGKKVLGVSYDVFDAFALRTFQEIGAEARQKWGDDLKVYIVHGKGRLDIGGISVVIAVGSPHRDEAFRACRYIIDEVKHRSPVWKLEHYEDGDSEWALGCSLCESRSPVQAAEHDHSTHAHAHAHH